MGMKLKKTLLTLLLAFGITILGPSVTADAAGFVQAPEGVKYQQDDGSFLSDAWVMVGTGIYRLDANGLVIMDQWIQVGDLWYYLDATGVCTNPTGSATAPATAAAGQTQNIFEAAGWLPFQTTDAAALNNGIAAGLVGFDGTKYWAAPSYVQMFQPAPSNETQAENTVWIPATGQKYHRVNDCGNMNPNKAKQISLSDAIVQGYSACSKCW